MSDQYPDEDPQGTFGPKWWRAIYTSIQSVFQGGAPPGKSILIPTGANAPSLAAQPPTLLSIYRAKMQQADAVEKDRVEQTKRNRMVYEHQIRDFLEEKLRNGFHPENYARLFMTLHIGSNPMRRIVNEVSIMYENPAKRKLVDPKAKQPKPTLPALPPPVIPPALKALTDGPPPVDNPKLPSSPPPATPTLPAPEDPESEIANSDSEIERLAKILELSGGPEEEETPFDELMEEYDWDVLLDKVEKLCMISPVVWVRPYVVYEYAPEMIDDVSNPGTQKPSGKIKPNLETGELCYIIYTPENAGCIPHPNDPARMIAWYYFAEELYKDGDQMKTRRVIWFWDDTLRMKLDAKWQLLDGPYPNDLKDVPVAEFRINLPNSQSYYEDGVGKDLYEATIEQCMLKTLQNQRFKDGAFKQLVIEGGDERTLADQVMGGPTPIFTGDEGTATVLDMTPAIKEMTDMWKARAEDLATTYGIDLAEYKGEGHPQSGFAKKLSRDKILKESRRRRKFFMKGEQDLYEKTCNELSINPLPDIGELNPDMQLRVDFAEPTFEEDPQVQIKVDAQELEMNACSVLDILRRKNPDLSDVELLKIANLNQEINKVFLTSDQSALIKLLASSPVAKPVSGEPKMGGGNGPPAGP